MSRQDVYTAYRMRDDPAADRQVISFTSRAQRQVAAGTIRRLATSLGYPDQPAQVTDPDLTQSFTDFSTDLASSITRGYNRQLAAYVKQLPEDVTPQTANMAPFDRGVREYNRTTLRNLVNSTAQHEAQRAFMENNGLTDKVPWTWEQRSDFEDECADAAAASPASLNELHSISGGSPPRHRSCDCTEEADLSSIDPSDLPAPDDLWRGGDSVSMSLLGAMRGVLARFSHPFDENEWQRNEKGEFEAYVGEGAEDSITAADGLPLLKSEEEQNPHAVAELTEGYLSVPEEIDPIVAVGQRVLDGNHRFEAARAAGVAPAVTRISEGQYGNLRRAGYDDTEISAAAHLAAGNVDAADHIDSQFPGSGVYERAASAARLLRKSV